MTGGQLPARRPRIDLDVEHAAPPIDLTPVRAGTVWHHRGVGYCLIRTLLSENARHDGTYQLDGAPVQVDIWQDGPTMLELIMDRARWADSMPAERVFDTWTDSGALVRIGRYAWRALTPIPTFPTGMRGAPDRWKLHLFRSPTDDEPPHAVYLRELEAARPHLRRELLEGTWTES
jgi:hypothetical protein